MVIRTFAWPVVVCLIFVGCNQSGLVNSHLKDSATTQSFKSGVFNPGAFNSDSFAAPLPVLPLTVTQFINLLRKRTKSPDLKLILPAGGSYSVCANTSGEQLLLLRHPKFSVIPIYSIGPDGQVYEWKKNILMNSSMTTAVPTKVFVKQPFGQIDTSNLSANNMYVLQSPLNENGYREQVLVPWLSHLCSETAKTCYFRIGKTIVNAVSGTPDYQFDLLGSAKAWIITGKYQDQDLSPGSIFWQQDASNYYSASYKAINLTHWRLQDSDSLDRIGTVELNSVEMPSEVATYLAAFNRLKKNVAQEVAIKGFDWHYQDNASFIFNNTTNVIRIADRHLKPTSASPSLSLADDSGGFWSRYAPTWLGGNRNTAVNTDIPGNQRALTYKDVNGELHGGEIITSRNDLATGMMVYDYRYFDRTTGQPMVRQVGQNGIQIGNPTSFQSYIDKQQAILDRTAYNRPSNGATPISVPNKTVSQVSGRPGETVSSLAADMVMNYGVQVGNATLQAQTVSDPKLLVGLVGLQTAVNFAANSGIDSSTPSTAYDKAKDLVTSDDARNQAIADLKNPSLNTSMNYFVAPAQVALYQGSSRLDAAGFTRAQQGATLAAEALSFGQNITNANQIEDPYLRQLRQTQAVGNVVARAAAEVATNPLAASSNQQIRSWQPVASEALKQTVMMPINQTTDLSEALIVGTQSELQGEYLDSSAEAARAENLAGEALKNAEAMAKKEGYNVELPSSGSSP